MITEWVIDEDGNRFPKYTEEQAQRIARAAWGIHFLLPHPDTVPNQEHAMNIREFNRAIQDLPPLARKT